ncbi:CDP-diacylglycerol diphosphatase [Labrys neptuniae]|uniref:CDP-diacylglycerol diphosphatase n=1 Tax=Labrys TaxID=204476 RepID=UPI00288E4E53|nr:CDP-diacylglycerol diphosphatase [Labrys neptuniae]MDT3381687.1 CDP-diacylglycerol diphosphatase [Labrys neptuniae]
MRMRAIGWRRTVMALAIAAVLAGLALFFFLARFLDPDALWKIVDGQCVPEQQQQAERRHCIEVDLGKGVDHGFAILKDNAPTKPYNYLLIPTKRITGIEDEALLAPDAENYFEHAWAARFHLGAILKRNLDWNMVALAVNSAKDRSQNQLHIHVGCVRPDIRNALKNSEAKLSEGWSPLGLPTSDRPYLALKLRQDSLSGFDPFRKIADDIPGARAAMGLQTVVVVGAVFGDESKGFYILSRRREDGSPAHGEDLIDPTCQLARQSQ